MPAERRRIEGADDGAVARRDESVCLLRGEHGVGMLRDDAPVHLRRARVDDVEGITRAHVRADIRHGVAPRCHCLCLERFGRETGDRLVGDDARHVVFEFHDVDQVDDGADGVGRGSARDFHCASIGGHLAAVERSEDVLDPEEIDGAVGAEGDRPFEGAQQHAVLQHAVERVVVLNAYPRTDGHYGDRLAGRTIDHLDVAVGVRQLDEGVMQAAELGRSRVPVETDAQDLDGFRRIAANHRSQLRSGARRV